MFLCLIYQLKTGQPKRSEDSVRTQWSWPERWVFHL